MAAVVLISLPDGHEGRPECPLPALGHDDVAGFGEISCEAANEGKFESP